ETLTKTYPVSDQPIRIALVPEGGRLVPNMENRVFVAATYPDGSPAAGCDVDIRLGKKAKDDVLPAMKTNSAGLAGFRFTPKADQFQPGQWGTRNVEALGGVVQQVGVQQSVLQLEAEARDAKGNKAAMTISLTSEPFGENVILRLDKAIYQGGDTLGI